MQPGNPQRPEDTTRLGQDGTRVVRPAGSPEERRTSAEADAGPAGAAPGPEAAADRGGGSG